MTCASLKTMARRSLPGSYRVLVTSCILLTFCPQFLAMMLADQVSGWFTGLLAQCILFLLVSVIRAGQIRMFLETARGRTCRLSDLLWSVRNHPDTPVYITVYLVIYHLGAFLPLGILMYLFRDAMFNSPFATAHTIYIPFVGSIPLVPALLLLIWIIPVIALNIRYALSFFIYADHPDYSAADILAESEGRMAGSSLFMLKLLLSFAGISVLGILSLGIGFWWIVPYMGTSAAHFYLMTSPPEPEEDEQDPMPY